MWFEDKTKPYNKTNQAPNQFNITNISYEIYDK